MRSRTSLNPFSGGSQPRHRYWAPRISRGFLLFLLLLVLLLSQVLTVITVGVGSREPIVLTSGRGGHERISVLEGYTEE